MAPNDPPFNVQSWSRQCPQFVPNNSNTQPQSIPQYPAASVRAITAYLFLVNIIKKTGCWLALAVILYYLGNILCGWISTNSQAREKHDCLGSQYARTFLHQSIPYLHPIHRTVHELVLKEIHFPATLTHLIDSQANACCTVKSGVEELSSIVDGTQECGYADTNISNDATAAQELFDRALSALESYLSLSDRAFKVYQDFHSEAVQDFEESQPSGREDWWISLKPIIRIPFGYTGVDKTTLGTLEERMRGAHMALLTCQRDRERAKLMISMIQLLRASVQSLPKWERRIDPSNSSRYTRAREWCTSIWSRFRLSLGYRAAKDREERAAKQKLMRVWFHHHILGNSDLQDIWSQLSASVGPEEPTIPIKIWSEWLFSMPSSNFALFNRISIDHRV